MILYIIYFLWTKLRSNICKQTLPNFTLYNTIFVEEKYEKIGYFRYNYSNIKTHVQKPDLLKIY